MPHRPQANLLVILLSLGQHRHRCVIRSACFRTSTDRSRMVSGSNAEDAQGSGFPRPPATSYRTSARHGSSSRSRYSVSVSVSVAS
jgi:hypothetical protein